jgi:putative component of membrane protein insertase Oxa1/YidC/SpoIIIJ protein YidD
MGETMIKTLYFQAMKIALVFFLLAPAIPLNAQSWDADKLLLSASGNSIKALNEAPKSDRKKTLSPLKFFYNISIGIYQSSLSPQIGASCIYETTCSRFSRQLVSEFGIVKGFFLSVDRVGRCNQLAALDSSPLRLNKDRKIIEYPSYFRMR